LKITTSLIPQPDTKRPILFTTTLHEFCSKAPKDGWFAKSLLLCWKASLNTPSNDTSNFFDEPFTLLLGISLLDFEAIVVS
jgi:hypothetical protein